MSEKVKHSEMSVDDIIKSIKGVIENHNKKPPVASASEDVLELTDEDLVNEDKLVIETSDHIIDQDDSILSNNATQEISSALHNFSNKIRKITRETTRQNDALEELVVRIMKPLLKNWLEENLAKIVRECVEKEIKRLIPNEDN